MIAIRVTNEVKIVDNCHVTGHGQRICKSRLYTSVYLYAYIYNSAIMRNSVDLFRRHSSTQFARF